MWFDFFVFENDMIVRLPKIRSLKIKRAYLVLLAVIIVARMELLRPDSRHIGLFTTTFDDKSAV